MKVGYKDLGTMSYKECWDIQRNLFDERLRHHATRQTSDDAGCLLVVEHTPVYTLGKSGKSSNMLISEEHLKRLGAEFFHIDRGGDITFHGPGQIVLYPILNLDSIGIGLRRYIELLESAVIDTVATYGIRAERLEGATGVWICDRDASGAPSRWRKICAIGVKASHFVTMHGLALNVATDLNWFTMINPCGFVDKGVTSIERETGKSVDIEQVKRLLVENLAKGLGVEVAY
ncbi:MAG: lipoyl(octanoyl) transferase LipB [Alistipes sp.]|nr:lipoyl(octanoyl) transferase LipB [Alistipes sp.]